MSNTRYSFGYTDPRVLLMNPHSYDGLGDTLMFADPNHFAYAMTTEQLRAAWLIYFGDRVVTTEDIRALHDPDAFYIAKALYDREQLHEAFQFDSMYHKYRLRAEA